MSGITIITEPTIRLVGRQTIDEAALDAFLSDEGVESWETDTDQAAQKLVEVGGRLCYKSYAKPRPGGNAAYLGHILEVGHGSVIEHAVYNFIITGVSRSFTHELVRHRAGWAYSQRSQRFCDEGDLSAVVPPALKTEVELAWLYIRRVAGLGRTALSVSGDMTNMNRPTRAEEAGLDWLRAVEYAQQSYNDLSRYLDGRDKHIEDKTLRRKRAREAARSVLPNATETQIFVTANARALRGFLEQRGDRSADAEIRAVAVKLCRVMKAESPNLFVDFEVVEIDGEECLACKYHKV